MRTKQVANIVGVSEQTVRLWANRYSEFLSMAATPEKGAIREYTDDDVRVFLTIKRESDRRRPLEEISNIIQGGDLVQEIPEVVESTDDVPIDEHMLALTRINALTTELERVRSEHQREVARLVKERDDAVKLREEERTKSDERLSDKEARINELEREIGRLEGTLAQVDKRRGLFGR